MTRVIDALAAVDAGADAIGMVFYPKAARRVSLDVAKQIVGVLPPSILPVGLFVDSLVDEILETTKILGIRTVQLHGNETPEFVSQLPELRIIKAIRADASTLASTLNVWRNAKFPADRLAAILLETAGISEPGGTGIENNWSLIESAQRDGLLAGLPPLIVAGGLTASNVGEVIGRLHPYAVDVSSGIEQTKGIKSVEKMQDFAMAVKATAQECISVPIIGPDGFLD